jgi:N-acetylmuramic acid 6-phosphate etherase
LYPQHGFRGQKPEARSQKPLPPDRGRIATERRHPASSSLHTLDVPGLVRLMNATTREVVTAMDRAAPKLSAIIAAAEPGFLRGGRIIYLGAGTSGRLGVLDASEAPPTFQVPSRRVVGLIAGGDRSLRRSSEGREDEPLGAVPALRRLRLTVADTVVGIAAGGTTPYVLGALAWVAAHAASLTALITCSPIARPPGVDHLIVIATGPELLTGSTRLKAGTATKLALNTISTALMVRAGKVHGNLMVDLRATNAKLRDRAARIVATLTGLDRAASFRLLARAGGEVKAAVVMRRLGLAHAAAEARLVAVGGRLDLALRRTDGG